MNIFGLMLDKQHIHQQEGVPNRLRPSMIVEVDPYLISLQLSVLDARHPGFKLLLFVKIVVLSSLWSSSFSPLYQIS